jgi:integrase
VRFPKKIRFRKAVVKIYGKSKACNRYRVCGYVAGKRCMSRHATYSDAKQAADKLVRQIAGGNQSAALNPQQAADALAALQRLQAFHQATGRRVSLLRAVSEYAENAARLNDHTFAEAIDGFLGTIVNVKRVDVAKAVEEFIEQRKGKTVSPKDGRRPRLSPEYHAQSAGWLREFGGTFPGYAVGELTKENLALYMAGHAKAAPKTRNARRGVVRMFLSWCVERDYLRTSHRLFETADLKHEPADPEEIDFYRPSELALMLKKADATVLPVVALAGLAGIRLKEICRLTWEDVFRVPGHVEITAQQAKTRSRRLVQICPALAAWLQPFRKRTGPVWSLSYDQVHWRFNRLLRSRRRQNPEPSQWPAPFVHLSALRLARQRRTDRPTGWQLARHDSPAL